MVFRFDRPVTEGTDSLAHRCSRCAAAPDTHATVARVTPSATVRGTGALFPCPTQASRLRLDGVPYVARRGPSRAVPRDPGRHRPARTGRASPGSRPRPRGSDARLLELVGRGGASTSRTHPTPDR